MITRRNLMIGAAAELSAREKRVVRLDEFV